MWFDDDKRAVKDRSSEMVVYHGTSEANAKKILKDGFDVTKSKTSKDTIFVGSKEDSAYGHKPVMLKVLLKKNSRIFDVNKSEDPQRDNDDLRDVAREQNADVIKNMMQGGHGSGEELEIVDPKSVKSIEAIKGMHGKWTNDNQKVMPIKEKTIKHRSFAHADDNMTKDNILSGDLNFDWLDSNFHDISSENSSHKKKSDGWGWLEY